MENQVTNNAQALRLFFTEDIFLVEDKNVKILAADSIMPVLRVDEIGDLETNEDSNANKNIQISEVEFNQERKVYEKEIEKPHLIEEPITPKVFKFLGGNKKSALILVNDQLNPVSSEQGRELLRKIVKAVDLGTPDFAVVNYANYPDASFVELRAFFKPQLMLAFGVEISDLQLNYVWEHEIIAHENTQIIFAPNLHQLEEDAIAKRLLWKNLQKIK